MSLKFGPPPPIDVAGGKIHLRAWTGRERMAVVDGVAAKSAELVHRAIEPLYSHAVDIGESPPSGEGAFNAIMGALPWPEHEAFIARVMALMGLADSPAPTTPLVASGNTTASGG